jgi:hypothetical protein
MFFFFFLIFRHHKLRGLGGTDKDNRVEQTQAASIIQSRTKKQNFLSHEYMKSFFHLQVKV